MDPSLYYAYEQQPRSRSLASTTDHSRYMTSPMQHSYDATQYQSHYQGGHPRLDYVPEEYPTNTYSSHSPQSTMSVASSASYPGSMPHQSSPREQTTVMPGSRSVSQPVPQNYTAYGQQLSPGGYPAQPSQDHYARHHHQSAQGGVSYGEGSPQMQHTGYNNYAHSSLSSHHPRRTHPAVSPVPIPPASPTGIERYACDRCDKTFSRAHDRKRHFETHHSPQPASHRCPFCKKDFSRADSLKRHCDNGCDKDPNRENA